MKKNNAISKFLTSAKEKFKKLPDVLAQVPEFFRIQNIDKILKVVSFVVSIAILFVFILIAVVLVLLDEIFMLISVAVLILGLLLSLINLFIIYGLGHIIAQNNQIMEDFNEKK